MPQRAEAIVEAATRPSLRFVVPKTEPQQACSMLFRTRDPSFVSERSLSMPFEHIWPSMVSLHLKALRIWPRWRRLLKITSPASSSSL